MPRPSLALFSYSELAIDIDIVARSELASPGIDPACLYQVGEWLSPGSLSPTG